MGFNINLSMVFARVRFLWRGQCLTFNLIIMENKTGLQAAVEAGVPAYSLNGDLPDLDGAQELKVDFMDDYWSPSAPGESKKFSFRKSMFAPFLNNSQEKRLNLNVLSSSKKMR